jgi:two-component system chemotaxis sensor kinase CheA
MELSRYLDLYLAESQEHLRELNRSLLELESGASPEAVGRAFRAAHTIKGMSATMGYRNVAEIAHGLEDRLAEIRDGRASATPAVVDALLADADALEQAVSTVVTAESSSDIETAPEAPAPVPAAAPAPAPAAPMTAPPGTGLVVVVTVRRDCALPAARALLARRNVEAVAQVLGADPEQPGEDFRGGEVRLFLTADADRAAVEEAARRAGDIESVVMASPRTEEPARGAAAAPGVAPRTRHVRVDLRRLDELADGIGELAVLRIRLNELLNAGDQANLREQLERAGMLIEALREVTLAMRMVPVGDIFDRFPRLVRDAARALGKEVEFRIEGRDIQVDRSVIDAMADPLVHLLRNAVDHGIESPRARKTAGKPPRGRIALRAFRERASVRILVEDDGSGIDAAQIAARARRLGLLRGDEPGPTSGDALLKLLAKPGFSTAKEVTEVSGRGVGLDVVAASLRAVGGSLELRTEQGAGSTFALRLPISLAVATALRLRVGGEQYAVPMTHVREAIELQDVEIARVRGREVVRLRGEAIPLLRLSELLALPERGQETAAVVAEIGERRAALAVDELVAREQIVVKPFDAAVGMLPFFSGVTLLADGRPALVLDPMTVL